MNIHPVTHEKGDKNRFCGPAAISIITGMTTGEAARLLRRVSGDTQVRGTQTWEVLRALRMCNLGFRPYHVPTETKIVTKKRSWFSRGGEYQIKKGELTLAGWLKETVPIRKPGRVFLVVAGTSDNQHWQVISGRRYCCGVTREIVSITSDKVKRRARVSEVYEILLHPGNRIKIPSVVRKPKPRVDPYKREVQQFLRHRKLPQGKIVRDGHIKDFVVPPCEHWPLGFSTMHHDWSDTFYRLEWCFEHPEELLNDGGHYSA